MSRGTAGAGDPRLGPPFVDVPTELPAATLWRVREILRAVCDEDGLGRNLQEQSRRKAYRAGINQALEEIGKTCWAV